MDGLQQIEYFFDFWYQHKDYLELLYRQDLFHVLLNRFNDYLFNRAKHEDIRDLNDYSLSYSSGGLWAVLFAWTKEGFKEDRKKLASVVYSLQA